jgi:glycosyltransferase involved in cell wall biosynthesis
MGIERNIAIVTYSLKMGGVESVIYNQVKGFERKGYKVEVLETLEEGVWKNYFIENNIVVKSIVKKQYLTTINHVKKISNYLKKFDIVLLNDAPLAQSVIGFLNPNTLVFPIYHMALAIMAKNVSGNSSQYNMIIAVSPLLKNFLLNQINTLKTEDILCIPNGIDTEKYSITTKENNLIKKVLFLGRISDEKGILLLPEIINQIKYNSFFKTIDVYGTGPYNEKLVNKINEFNLQNQIIIKGSVEPQKVSEILKKYDILLMPSYKEGHPIVLLEAMSCGVVPVVTLLEGSTNIVVQHEKNGYLCESGNIESFILNLEKALNNKNLSSLSQLANKKIIEEYSVDKMVNSYIDIFKKHNNSNITRTNKIDTTLLGDLYYLPYILVRPVRKILKILNLWKEN